MNLLALRRSPCGPTTALLYLLTSLPSPGLVTESRRIEWFCTSLCEFDREKKMNQGEKDELKQRRKKREYDEVCLMTVSANFFLAGV